MKLKSLLVCLGLLLSTTSAMAAKLTVGNASYTAGSTVRVPIILDYEGATPNISILSLDVTYDTTKLTPVVTTVGIPIGTIGTAAGAAGKSLYSNILSSTGTGKARLLIAGGMTPDTNNPKGGTMNDVVGGKSSVLAAGEVASMTFTVAGGTAGTISLGNVADASNPDAISVPINGVSGTLNPGASGRVGDCNRDGNFNGADIQYAINISIERPGFVYNELCDVNMVSGVVIRDGVVNGADVQTMINVNVEKPGWVFP